MTSSTDGFRNVLNLLSRADEGELRDLFASSEDAVTLPQFMGLLQRNRDVNDDAEDVEFAMQATDLFKQMEVRGEGNLRWEDFSAFVMQMDLMELAQGKDARHKYLHSHTDPNTSAKPIRHIEYFGEPINRLAVCFKNSEVVHLMIPPQLPGELPRASLGQQLRHHTAYRPQEVLAVHHLAGEDMVVTSSTEGLAGPHHITVWDLPTAEERAGGGQHLPVVYCQMTIDRGPAATVLHFSTRLELLFTASESSGKVFVWDINTGERRMLVKLHECGIRGLVELKRLRSKANFLVSAAIDGNLVVWDLAVVQPSTEEIKDPDFRPEDHILATVNAHEYGVYCMAYIPGYELLVSAGGCRPKEKHTAYIYIWNCDEGSRTVLTPHRGTRYLIGHECQVLSLLALPAEDQLLSIDILGHVRIWDLKTLTCRQHLAFPNELGNRIPKDARQALASVPAVEPLTKGGIRTHRMLMVGFPKLEILQFKAPEIKEAVVQTCYNTYFEDFVVASTAHITVWDGRTGKLKSRYSAADLCGGRPKVEITAFSLDDRGRKFLIGDDGGGIHVCSSNSGQCLKALDPHSNQVTWLTYIGPTKSVVSCAVMGSVHVADETSTTGYLSSSKALTGSGSQRASLSSTSKTSSTSKLLLTEDPKPAPPPRSTVLLRNLTYEPFGPHMTGGEVSNPSMVLGASQSGLMSPKSHHSGGGLGLGDLLEEAADLADLSKETKEFKESKDEADLEEASEALGEAIPDIITGSCDLHLNLVACVSHVGTSGQHVQIIDYEMFNLLGTCVQPQGASSRGTSINSTSSPMSPGVPSVATEDSTTSLAFMTPCPALAGGSSGRAVHLWAMPDGECKATLMAPKNPQTSSSAPSIQVLRWASAPWMESVPGRDRLDGDGERSVSPPRTPTTRQDTGKSPKGDNFQFWEAAASSEQVGSEACLFAGDSDGMVIRWTLTADFLKLLNLMPVPPRRRPSFNPHRFITSQVAAEDLEAMNRRAKRIARSQAGSLKRRACTLQFMAHSSAITSLEWISNPPTLVTGAEDGTSKIWSIARAGDAVPVCLGKIDFNDPIPLPGSWTFRAQAQQEDEVAHERARRALELSRTGGDETEQAMAQDPQQGQGPEAGESFPLSPLTPGPATPGAQLPGAGTTARARTAQVSPGRESSGKGETAEAEPMQFDNDWDSMMDHVQVFQRALETRSSQVPTSLDRGLPAPLTGTLWRTRPTPSPPSRGSRPPRLQRPRVDPQADPNIYKRPGTSHEGVQTLLRRSRSAPLGHGNYAGGRGGASGRQDLSTIGGGGDDVLASLQSAMKGSRSGATTVSDSRSRGSAVSIKVHRSWRPDASRVQTAPPKARSSHLQRLNRLRHLGL